MTIYLGADQADRIAGILAKECDFYYESIAEDQAPYADLEDYYFDFLACVTLFDQINYMDGIYGNYHTLLDECYRKLYGEDL